MADVFLTVNTLKLDRDGFCIARDLTDLITRGPLRGEDFLAQGVDGETFRAKNQGKHVALVGLLIFGSNDKDGIAHPDSWSGIRANVEQINTSCVTGSKSALVTATLTYPDATTRSASVYCPRLDVGLYRDDRSGAAVQAALEIVIPAGALT